MLHLLNATLYLSHTLSLFLCFLALFPLLSIEYKNPWHFFADYPCLRYTHLNYIVYVSLRGLHTINGLKIWWSLYETGLHKITFLFYLCMKAGMSNPALNPAHYGGDRCRISSVSTNDILTKHFLCLFCLRCFKTFFFVTEISCTASLCKHFLLRIQLPSPFAPGERKWLKNKIGHVLNRFA